MKKGTQLAHAWKAPGPAPSAAYMDELLPAMRERADALWARKAARHGVSLSPAETCVEGGIFVSRCEVL